MVPKPVTTRSQVRKNIMAKSPPIRNRKNSDSSDSELEELCSSISEFEDRANTAKINYGLIYCLNFMLCVSMVILIIIFGFHWSLALKTFVLLCMILYTFRTDIINMILRNRV